MTTATVPLLSTNSTTSHNTDEFYCEFPYGHAKELLLFNTESVISRIFLVVFQITFIIGTLILNVIIIITTAKNRKLWQSATILIGFLAITDAFVGICSMPLFLSAILMELVQGERTLDTREYCTLSKAALNSGDLGMGWSFITISLITFERYVAIFYPFWYRKYVTTSGVVKTTIIIWIIWALVVVVLVLDLSSVQFIIGIAILVFVIFVYALALPGYLRIVCLLKTIEASQATNANRPKIDRKGSITCAIIVVCFLLCYTPLIVTSIVIIANGGSSSSITYAFPWTRFLLLSNSLFNPVIYLARNKIIRRASRDILTKLFKNTNHRTESQFRLQTVVARFSQSKQAYDLDNNTAVVISNRSATIPEQTNITIHDGRFLKTL